MKPDIKIPGYVIERQLGSGGMAVVYLAIQESFGREVALKIMHRDHAGEKDFAERFLREARIVSRLVHPNIVTVYDVGVHDGYRYLSMEYIHGKDLKEIHSTLTRRELVRVIKDVARALDYAASKGYVHRDVKPENIMIREEDGRVVLMDFGIARDNDNTLTRTGKAIGTPYYMSPEQTKGATVDHRSDIYSLGVVLYQMLTGYVPYDADSAVGVGIKHLTKPIPLLPDHLKMFQPIINTAMAKDREHRYQSAGELIEALDQISDAALEALDARATAFRLAGKDHEAKTLATPALSMNSVPQILVSQNRTAVNTHRTITVPPSIPRRRRAFLFFLLLITLGFAAFLKQDLLIETWNTWQPVIMVKLGIQPAHKTAISSKSNTVAKQTQKPAPLSTGEESTTLPSEQKESSHDTDNLPATRERITQLRASLDADPENAVELASLYREILTRQSRSPAARLGLKDLREWYAQQLRAAMNEKDLARTRLLLDGLKSSFPRARQSEKIRHLEQTLVRAEAVQAHLQLAKDYTEQQALTEPDGANALEEIKAALALEPDNEQANMSLQHIANTCLDLAKQDQSIGKYSEAILAVQQGLKAVEDDRALLDLQTRLHAQIKEQSSLNAVLKQADSQLQAGHLITPSGTSAYDQYRSVLKSDPDNQGAQSGLKAIEKKLAGRANTATAQGELEQAKAIIASAQKRFGNSSSVRDAKAQLARAIEVTRPKVTRLLLSSSPLPSLDAIQEDRLQLTRILYVGFEYTNFEPENTLLQAILMDGTGQVKIAQKPVIVSGKAGEHFFDIQLPVEGFTEGSYKLELVLGNDQLTTSSFLVYN